jgi:flagellar biosynthesis protein FlhG
MSGWSQNKRTIAFGGGKGGIGKSFIASNLAITLARSGFSVTLIDLDLGGANIHTCLGMPAPKLSLTDFLVGRVSQFTDLVHPTPVPGLYVVSGFGDAFNIADLSAKERQNIIRGWSDLPTDLTLIDLGAGTTENTLDFFNSARVQVLTSTPEPTSLENAHRFLKSAFYRKFKQAEKELGIEDLVAAAMDQKNNLGLRTPADLIHRICQVDYSKGVALVNLIKEFNLQIVMNQVRSRPDVDVGLSLKSICRKYFGIQAEYLGHLDHDNAVWQAQRRRRPLVLEYPSSSLVAQFTRMAKLLVQSESLREAA